MSTTLYTDARIVSDGTVTHGWLLTDGPFITAIGSDADTPPEADSIIDCTGDYLLPGVIDTHVHFRDPGLTDKADISTESRAALAGGVTSWIDMPNTRPATVSVQAVADKLARAASVSATNYGFFIGATNSNLPELLAADYTHTAGIKLFLGSSTGNMLVDDDSTLSQLFAKAPALIAVHAEDESIIREARTRLQGEYPDGIPVTLHPDMRPRAACIAATRHAIALAEKTGARLHICHISTADELELIAAARMRGVRVTAETCPQYLMWDRADFDRLGSRIKCNPAIKDAADRIALLRQLRPGGVIDTIATDHAPHLLSQKQGDAVSAASGMPMIQFSLPAMLDLITSDPQAEGIDIPRIVSLMCHAPASIFGIDRRGYLRPGYYADITRVRHLPLPGRRITDADVISRCGWTPLDNTVLSWQVIDTVVNGGTGPMPLVFKH